MSESERGEAARRVEPTAPRQETPPGGTGPAEPGEALAGVVARLREELAGVRRAMRNRAVIEQAKGVLVARLGVSPDEAFDRLVQISQQANVKLAEVAAALVGVTAPMPGAGAGPIDAKLRRYLEGERQPAADPRAEALRAQHHLLASRIAAAREYPEIADAIAGSSVGWPSPDAVLIELRGPADEPRPVGRYGKDDTGTLAAASQRAHRDGAPVWAADTGVEGMRTVLAVPLTAGDTVVGALAVGWVTGARPDATERRYLSALAEPIGRRVDTLAAVEVPGDTDDPVRVVLDSIPTPAALMSPIRDDEGRVTDFRYDYPNEAAAATLNDPGGPDAADRTLLAVFPDTGSRLLLGEFAAVLADGAPRSLSDVPADTWVVARISAARLGDRLLVVWQPRSEADLMYDQLLQAERIGRLGSYWWRPDTGEARFTPELYRLLGRDPEQGAVPLTETEEYIHPDDRAAVRTALREALDGRGFTVEHRLADAPGRRLRVSGEPEFAPDGTVHSLRGTMQDVTAERAVESRLRRTQEALAAQRQRLEAESRAAETLRQALLPTDPELTATPGLTVHGLCRSPEDTGRVAGDWYDVFSLGPSHPHGFPPPTPGGKPAPSDGTGDAAPAARTYLVVGDVTGSGLTATIAAARLRNAIRAYAGLGMAPAEVLTALNRLVADFSVDQLATLVIARFTPGTRRLQWAAAGQAAPLRYAADGAAAVLTGPLGLPIGAAPDVEYGEATVDVSPGDRLLLYTDGLVARRDRTLADGLDVLLHAARHTTLPDLVDHVSTRLDSAPTDDLAVLMALC